MRETSKGAVEKAEAVVLIGQKVFIASRILRAVFVLQMLFSDNRFLGEDRRGKPNRRNFAHTNYSPSESNHKFLKKLSKPLKISKTPLCSGTPCIIEVGLLTSSIFSRPVEEGASGQHKSNGFLRHMAYDSPWV